MLIKFFKTNSGGGKSGIDYLLNGRVANKTAYVIKGNEHIDKGRLELNFVIPKIDLESGLAFNPYYHKADMPLIDSWQNYTNLRFNFSDPKDPAKSHILQGQRKELSLIKYYIELERILISS